MSAEAGFIEGTFAINAYPKFLCQPVHLRVETASSPFTSLFREGEVIRLPIAHKEGRFITTPETMAALNREHRVAFRFCDEKGVVSEATNHNGSLESVTGVLGQYRNVLALMPHPERASEDVLGSTDGRRIFESMIRHVEVEG
jgi:phosphoribosylformylglycinamidine synthase